MHTEHFKKQSQASNSMWKFKWITTNMIEYDVKKKGIIFQYPFFKSWRIQEAKSSKNTCIKM